MGHSRTGSYDDANLVAQPLPNGPRKVVVRGGSYGRYLPSGHLTYVHDGTLFAVPFDLDRLEVTGQPVPAVEGVDSGPGAGAQVAVSANGTLVYLPSGTFTSGSPVHWVDREGKTTLLRGAPANWSNLVFAPDRRRLALDINDGRQVNVWTYEWARDTLSRVTLDQNDQKPVWTPDGGRLVFGSQRPGPSNLYWQRADGTGEVQRLTESKRPQFPASWHPSGKFLAFVELTTQNYDLMILPMEGDEASGWKPGEPTVFLNTPFAEDEPMFSPDGRWIAYTSTESGQPELYVRPFPGPGGKWLISTNGGNTPTWSRARRELFYATRDQRIMRVPFGVEGDSFHAGKPQAAATPGFIRRLRSIPGGGRSFDLHPDGERFARAATSNTDAERNQDKVVFIFNFFDELRRIAPVAKR